MRTGLFSARSRLRLAISRLRRRRAASEAGPAVPRDPGALRHYPGAGAEAAAGGGACSCGEVRLRKTRAQGGRGLG